MGSKNPYITNLTASLENLFDIVNKAKNLKYGIVDLYLNFYKTDAFYLNWIEDISFKRFGTFQALLTIPLLIGIKIFRKKLIWTMHNKSSHLRSNSLYKFIYKFLIKYSDIIVCHTQESAKNLTEKEYKGEIFYFFHPFNLKSFPADEIHIKKDIDILIWGTINQYKGVLEFFENTKDQLKDIRIQVIGNFPDNEYFNKVKKYRNNYINIENRFIECQELKELHKRSNFVLFPYNGNSVLNSGALVDSLALNSIIIAPNTGTFKDLAKLNLIYTYNEYSEIIDIVSGRDIQTLSMEKIIFFCNDHSWEKFAEMFSKLSIFRS